MILYMQINEYYTTTEYVMTHSPFLPSPSPLPSLLLQVPQVTTLQIMLQTATQQSQTTPH